MIWWDYGCYIEFFVIIFTLNSSNVPIQAKSLKSKALGGRGNFD